VVRGVAPRENAACLAERGGTRGWCPSDLGTTRARQWVTCG
jgi:hypothetical protein